MGFLGEMPFHLLTEIPWVGSRAGPRQQTPGALPANWTHPAGKHRPGSCAVYEIARFSFGRRLADLPGYR